MDTRHSLTPASELTERLYKPQSALRPSKRQIEKAIEAAQVEAQRVAYGRAAGVCDGMWPNDCAKAATVIRTLAEKVGDNDS